MISSLIQYCMPEEGVPLSPDSKILTRSQVSLLRLFFKL